MCKEKAVNLDLQKWDYEQEEMLSQLSMLEGKKNPALSWQHIANCMNYLFGTQRTPNACSKKYRKIVERELLQMRVPNRI